MFPPTVVRFLTLIGGLNAVYAVYDSPPKYGLNATCGRYVQATAVTDAIPVCQDPYYDPDEGTVYYVDEQTPTAVHSYVIDTKEHYSVDLESQGCSSASAPTPIKDAPGKFLVGCNDYLCILTWDGKSKNATAFKRIIKPVPEHSWPAYHVKSGKVGPSGAFFIYSETVLNGSNPVNTGILIAIVDGKPKKMAQGFIFGTGLAFSYDKRTIYFCDLYREYLYKANYNPRTHSMANVQILLNFTKDTSLGRPDGITIDAQGCIWVACFGAGLVIRVDPFSGYILCSVSLNVKGLTNLCFGRCPHAPYGTMACLYVSTQQKARPTDGPTSGSLYLIKGVNAYGPPPDRLLLRTIDKSREACYHDNHAG